MDDHGAYADVDTQPNSWWARVRRMWGVAEPDEEGAVGDDQPMPRAARPHPAAVAVRLNAQAFHDARAAADGLKSGQQQIVNFERAAEGTAERMLDYLCGVTYALDGTVERLGDKVFLFAPASVTVEVDGGSEATLS